jgi:hypothetical protein
MDCPLGDAYHPAEGNSVGSLKQEDKIYTPTEGLRNFSQFTLTEIAGSTHTAPTNEGSGTSTSTNIGKDQEALIAEGAKAMKTSANLVAAQQPGQCKRKKGETEMRDETGTRSFSSRNCLTKANQL